MDKNFPCYADYFPCFRSRNSLFVRAGNFAENAQFTDVIRRRSGLSMGLFCKFPCIFPCYQGIWSGDGFAMDCVVSQPVWSLRVISER